METTDNIIRNNLETIRATLPPYVKLVAVSKFHSPESILKAYECGQRVFGESREQELRQKQQQLPKDIEWHFIGHLQTNKVKYIIPYIHLIESVDSVRLLAEIDKQAKRIGRSVNCLLEINISGETQKYGFSSEACLQFFESNEWKNFSHINIMGLMGMAQNSEDPTAISSEFSTLYNLFCTVKERYFPMDPTFKEISMGMSQDYHTAIKQGSTMVRIGSAIFGDRL